MKKLYYNLYNKYQLHQYHLDTEWGRKYLTQADINAELQKQIKHMKEKMRQLAEIDPGGGILFNVVVT